MEAVELNGYLDDFIKPDERDEFVIDSDAKADWALRKIADNEKECARLTTTMNAWMSYYARKMEDLDAQCERENANLKSMLKWYFESVPHRKTKTQESYELPSGKLVRKTQEPTYELNNSELLPWVRANAPDCVKVVESPTWGELKKRLTVSGEEMVNAETGEIVPGIKVTAREPEFKVVIS